MVSAGATQQAILACTSKEPVSPRAAEEPVAALLTAKGVSAGTTHQLVGAGTAADQVVTPERADDVAPGTAQDHVAFRCAGGDAAGSDNRRCRAGARRQHSLRGGHFDRPDVGPVGAGPP